MEWVILTPTLVVVRQSVSPPTQVAVAVLAEAADKADGLGAFKVIIRAFCKLHISIIPMTHYHRDDFVYLYT
jgi:hypothetical protein